MGDEVTPHTNPGSRDFSRSLLLNPGQEPCTKYHSGFLQTHWETGAMLLTVRHISNLVDRTATRGVTGPIWNPQWTERPSIGCFGAPGRG